MHLGKQIIAQQTGLAESSEEVTQLYEKMYDDFIEAFDANDNGISAYDTTQLEKLGVSKRFSDRGFSIASVVNRYNYMPTAVPSTATSENGAGENSQVEEDARFLMASAFTGQQFTAELNDTHKSWLPARQKVHAAFQARTKHHPSGSILVLEEGLPWHDHLFNLEEAENCQGSVLYTLFPENDQKDSKWRIRAVSKSAEGFELRKPLAQAWRGVRDEELDAVSGIKGCVFVHASGFIGGNKTFEGALEMATKSLEMD